MSCDLHPSSGKCAFCAPTKVKAKKPRNRKKLLAELTRLGEKIELDHARYCVRELEKQLLHCHLGDDFWPKWREIRLYLGMKERD